MKRLASLLGIAAALSIGIFIASLFDSSITPSTTLVGIHTAASTPSPSQAPHATVTSTPTVIPSSTPTPQKKTTVSTPVPTKVSVPKSATVSIPVPFPTPASAAALDASAAILRAALVNIICYAPQGTTLHSISGSGVFIDPKGIILTNAHIAQYFLLANRDVSCIIRSGSPAVKNYNAALMYISPVWLRANATVLTQKTPNGTGEYDFALLAVTKSATTAALPSVFPSLPLAQVPPLPGTPVIIASYAAQFLDSNQVQSSLFPTVVFGSVKDVFTFVKNTIDVLSLGGSAAAQEGSSGGGVAEASGMLVGTITTSTIQGDTSTRILSAITASYIRAEYASETGKALDLLLAAPTLVSVADFTSQIPTLEAILTAHLP